MGCKNCGLELEQKTNFCLDCGAKVIRNRLTIKNLFAHAVEQFLSIDNKFLITFMHLFTKPEEVIDGYIKGLRKKYINPINYFAIALTLSGVLIFLIRKFFLDELDFSGFGSNTNNEGSIKMMNTLFDYNSFLFVIYIPLLAIASKLIFLDQKYNFTEHVLVFIYTQAHYSIVSFPISIIVLLLIPQYYGYLGLIFILLILIYSVYVLKRIFKLEFGDTFLRLIGFSIVYLVLFYGVFIVMFVIFFLTGELSMEDFKPSK